MKQVGIDVLLDFLKKDNSVDLSVVLESLKDYPTVTSLQKRILFLLRQRVRLLTPPKPKISTKVFMDKCCPTCKKIFNTWRGDQTYCKPVCYPGNKERKRLRKRFIRDSKPAWVSWAEIAAVYKACPPDHHVDHIIPLNHPDVCGLHVPWNLQYLPVKTNIEKSNKWDGTYSNLGWKET